MRLQEILDIRKNQPTLRKSFGSRDYLTGFCSREKKKELNGVGILLRLGVNRCEFCDPVLAFEGSKWAS